MIRVPLKISPSAAHAFINRKMLTDFNSGHRATSRASDNLSQNERPSKAPKVG